MADRSTTRPQPQPPPAGDPLHKQALYDAVGDVIRKQAEERKAQAAEAERNRRKERRVSPVIVTCLAILLSVGAYVAIEQPEWLFPRPLPTETPAEREATLRLAIATTAQRIERFRQQHGRLPVTLAQAGSTVEMIRYERDGDAQYVLRGENGPVTLTYNSLEPISSFIGNSFQLLARRGRR